MNKFGRLGSILAAGDLVYLKVRSFFKTVDNEEIQEYRVPFIPEFVVAKCGLLENAVILGRSWGCQVWRARLLSSWDNLKVYNQNLLACDRLYNL